MSVGEIGPEIQPVQSGPRFVKPALIEVRRAQIRMINGFAGLRQRPVQKVRRLPELCPSDEAKCRVLSVSA